MRVLLRIAAKYYIAPGGLASELANVSRWRLRAFYYAQVRGGAGHLRIVPTGAELLLRPVRDSPTPPDSGRGAPTG